MGRARPASRSGCRPALLADTNIQRAAAAGGPSAPQRGGSEGGPDRARLRQRQFPAYKRPVGADNLHRNRRDTLPEPETELVGQRCYRVPLLKTVQ